jgi:YD repeat-containing protein
VTTTDAATNAPATKRYHYEDNRSLNTHALTGLTDALGVRITTYTYDALGQVASTEKAQGLEKLTFQLSSPVGANSVIFYTPAPGAASTATLYGFSSLAGVLRPTSVSSPPCPLCGASAAVTDYDANQRKSKVVAHDGSVTFYTYNAKGRVTREATYPASYQSAMTAPPLGAAESVSSTQWHGTWNLPLKVAEAYLITSYSYDARGNLLEMVETPTTDTTGAKGFNATPSGESQTTRWTYDTNNLPTTIVELAGSTETGRWDMTYNPTGDLTGITHVTSGTVATLVPAGNGASQVTSITQSASPAVNPAMATVRTLGLVRPAGAATGVIEDMPGGWRSSPIKAGEFIKMCSWVWRPSPAILLLLYPTTTSKCAELPTEDSPRDCKGDDCIKVWGQEYARCPKWAGRGPKDDPHRWVRACKERAGNRMQLCFGNGGSMPDDAPSEWSEDDFNSPP